MCWLSGWRVETSLLDYPKHITHILHQDPGDVGDRVDVVFSVVGEAGAGDEVKVFEDGVEAFGEAGVEFAQWDIGVDQEDRVVGGGVGHVRVVVERCLRRHGVNPWQRRIATIVLRNKRVAAMRGFADRRINTMTRQTRRSPTHNRHKTWTAGSRPNLTEQGVNLKGCETLSLI